MILISGATGFLGSYLLFRLLKEGHQVRAIKRSSSNLKQVKLAFDFLNQNEFSDFESYNQQIDWVDADLTCLADLKTCFHGIDEIFHLSAIVSFQGKEKDYLLNVNVGATKNMTDLALENGVNKFHFVSSIASLGRGDKETIDESEFSHHKKQGSVYGISKYMSELEVWRSYKEGLKGVIVNPGVVIGPAVEENEVSKIFRLIQKGFKYYTKGVNGYIDVRDVADFLYELSRDEKLYNERYILVSDNVSYKELFQQMYKHFEIPTKAKEANYFLSYLVSILDRFRAFISRSNAIITPELLKLATSRYYYNNSKVINALKKDFIEVEKSVADTCQFLKKV
jgi:nucleoside-diphosphate-sugar epimerase